ncbi:MAG TPA: N-acetyltransferase [Anaerolineae bacterium]|nr:N-acetyltransferase [Anaerolineae bacterium]HIP70464.1 N-acetyltransferase [Anaerolineae bacterium]
MNIEYAALSDLDYLAQNDEHITAVTIRAKIERQEIIIIRHEDQPVGWLRFGYFWDEHPFMNMLWLDEAYRGRGWGQALVIWWEEQMQLRGHHLVFTSTQSDENAQHFYRKLGYRDCGALLLPDEPLEIILLKNL